MNGSDVAVVIPTANRWHMLERTVAALRAQSVTGFEIVVVVDDGAEPPPFLADVQVVYRKRRGVGAARNDGVRATERPIIMFLGDDTIPEPDLMARHLAVHSEHPEVEVGVLGDVPWAPEVANGRLQRWLDWSGTQFEYHTITGDEAGWGRLYSSNVTLKRELFQKVGGFDEEFMFGYEDIELGLRLHEAGMRLLYEPRARVSHVHRYDWPAIQRRFRLVGGGEYLMVHKHPDFPPYFLKKLLTHRPVAPFSPWPWLVDYVPTQFTGVRRRAEKRADAWYSKQLVAPFAAGWLAAEELEEEQMALDHYDQIASERLAELSWLGEILPLVPRGAALLVVASSPTIGRELAAAGYQVTLAVPDETSAANARRRLDRQSVRATVVVGEPDASSSFDLALIFRIDRVPDAMARLDVVEGQSALVSFSVGNNTTGAGEVLARARRRKPLLDLEDSDGSVLVTYQGQRPRPLVDRPAQHAIRESLARLAASRFGRRRPWIPRLQRATAPGVRS